MEPTIKKAAKRLIEDKIYRQGWADAHSFGHDLKEDMPIAYYEGADDWFHYSGQGWKNTDTIPV